MPRICDITGARTTAGMNVSHSNRHTKRTFKPNLQSKTLQSDLLGRGIRFRLTTRAIRTLDKYNGLDGFMLNVKNRRVIEDFSDRARKIRKEIMKAAGITPGKVKTPAKKPAAKKTEAPADTAE